MNLIQGLHGAVAIVLLCSLLFAEEAGVPIPLPGELVLVAAGVLIGTGGLDPWMFPPLPSRRVSRGHSWGTAGPGW